MGLELVQIGSKMTRLCMRFVTRPLMLSTSDVGRHEFKKSGKQKKGGPGPPFFLVAKTGLLLYHANYLGSIGHVNAQEINAGLKTSHVQSFNVRSIQIA